jgi:flagellar hook-associated protein 3 FlgL
MTRISSFHNYQAVQNDMMRQQTKLSHNTAQMASGKKLLTAGDDPVAMLYSQNLRQQSEEIKQYLDAIMLGRNRLERNEIAIANAETYSDEAKRTVMEMINGSLSKEDRHAHAQDLQGLFDNMLNLGNTMDESGNFLFAGTKARTQPFFRANDGTVSYAGDDYQRKVRVSNSIEVPVNDPGSKLFMEIRNPFGEFEPVYDLEVGSTLLLTRATNSDYLDKSEYSVSFFAAPNGQYNYQLSKDGSMVSTGEYDPSKSIEFGSVAVQVRGEFKSGDTINLTPQRTFNMFDTFQEGIVLSERDLDDATGTAELHKVTEQFSAAFINLNRARADVGSRQGTLDNQENQHDDYNLTLAKSISNIEDLDYSKAVIDFNENTLALKASQQAFAKTKDISLFNYI